MMMAYFDYTQYQLSWRFFCWAIVTVLCTPLSLTICHSLGHRRGFNVLWFFRIVQMFILGPTIALHHASTWTFLIMHSVLSGQLALDEALRAHIVGKDMNSKFNALDQLTSCATTSLAAYAYGELFDAKAT